MEQSMLFLLKMLYTFVLSQHSILANQETLRSWFLSSCSINCPMCISFILPGFCVHIQIA